MAKSKTTLHEAVEALAKRWERERQHSLDNIATRLPINDYLGAYVEAERAARYEVGAAQLRDILKAGAATSSTTRGGSKMSVRTITHSLVSNDKLRALWMLVRRAGGELHIPAEEVASAPLALGVTSVRQPDGSISLWADEAGAVDD